jgi:hypothetical protein
MHCSSTNYPSLNIKDGLYYGKNKGFFPQSIIFAKVQTDSIQVDCYLPLKGQYFHLLHDTLLYHQRNDTLFVGKRSIVIQKKNELFFYFSSNNSRATKLAYSPHRNEYYSRIKEIAKCYDSSE